MAETKKPTNSILSDPKKPSPSPSPILQRSFTYHHSSRPSSKPLLRANKQRSPKLILFFTSLRGVRKTFDDCRGVRSILRSLRLSVDDRDLSMDSSFRRDLQALLPKNKPFSLPQLFLDDRWIGSAEEIFALHESGELSKVLEGVALEESGFVCGGCGGARFVNCFRCSGSRKVFSEEEGRVRRCGECNENGLVRCEDCCF